MLKTSVLVFEKSVVLVVTDYCLLKSRLAQVKTRAANSQPSTAKATHDLVRIERPVELVK